MKKIKLGLCMPGAVTSGAYTAGVINYILETLDLWEKHSKESDTNLPPMYLELSAAGGTSAGGMSTIMMILQLMGKKGVLEDSWINLDDDEKQLTLDKILDTSDLTKNKRVSSLLNSSFIDSITERAFNITGDIDQSLNNLPNYVSKDFKAVLSHTLLNGVPLSLELSNDYFSTRTLKDSEEHIDYVTYEHSFFSYYSINKKESYSDNPMSPYIFFNPFDKNIKARIKLATQATGAFPIGLQPRILNSNTFPSELVLNSIKQSLRSRHKNVILESIQKEMYSNEDEFWDDVFKHVKDEFSSMTIDGGAMNNAPIGQILSLLNSDDKNDCNLSALIQIDPYPDRISDHYNNYKPNKNFIPLIISTIGALWGGSKTKRDEIINQENLNIAIGEVFPAQKINKDKTIESKFVLATSAVNAFGGLLDKKLRQFDYDLGQENAKKFLRHIYCFPVEEKDEIETKYKEIREIWNTNPKSIKAFQKRKAQRGNKNFIPIIPDIRILTEPDNSEDPTISKIPRPKVSMDIIKVRKRKIKRRIKALSNNINMSAKSEKSNLKRGIIINAIFWVIKRFKTKMYKGIYGKIQGDLKDRELLK